MTEDGGEPALYRELASWFHLITAPEEYAEEAAAYWQLMRDAAVRPIETILELGSGGGNNASHLKHHARLTLTDLSEEMLEISRGINPECEHLLGDMRTLRLDREFDAVFVHDAIDYLTSEEDLSAAMQTAWMHCRPGGVALFVPDHVRETFMPGTDHGGFDDGARGARYLEWAWDPDPSDATYVVDYAFLLREEDGNVRVERDRHICGLFPRARWLELLSAAGFRAETRAPDIGEDEPHDVFIGARERDA